MQIYGTWVKTESNFHNRKIKFKIHLVVKNKVNVGFIILEIYPINIVAMVVPFLSKMLIQPFKKETYRKNLKHHAILTHDVNGEIVEDV